MLTRPVLGGLQFSSCSTWRRNSSEMRRQEDYFGSVLAVFFPPALMATKLPLWSKLSSSIICVSCNNFLLSLPVSNMVSSYSLFPTQQLEQACQV